MRNRTLFQPNSDYRLNFISVESIIIYKYKFHLWMEVLYGKKSYYGQYS